MINRFLFTVAPLLMLAPADSGGGTPPAPAAPDELTKLREENAKLQKQLDQARSSAKQPAQAPGRPWPADMILNRNEHSALTPEQREAFRLAGGTVTENPDYAKKREKELADEAARIRKQAEKAADDAIRAAAEKAISGK